MVILDEQSARRAIQTYRNRTRTHHEARRGAQAGGATGALGHNRPFELRVEPHVRALKAADDALAVAEVRVCRARQLHEHRYFVVLNVQALAHEHVR